MNNLRKSKGTFKGLISECMFKLTEDKAILTSFMTFNRFRSLYPIIPEEKLTFLKKHWRTIDALEVFRNKIVLYEIKSQNYYTKYIPPKPKATKAQIDCYEKAMKLGFEVIFARVFYFDDWKFSVKKEPFRSCIFSIDRPKKYDGPIRNRISYK